MSSLLVQRGVVSGLDVLPQGTPDMTVDVIGGSALFDNVLRGVTGNTALGVSGEGFVNVDSAGNLTFDAGTLPPDSSKLAVAYIVPFGSGPVCDASAIYDLRGDPDGSPIGQYKRPFVQLPEPGQTFAYSFLAGAQSAVDPGVGNFGFDTNNSSTAHLYVNYTTASAVGSIHGWLQSGLAGNAFGALSPWYLRVWSRQDPSKWVLLEVTGFTDHSTWADLAVTGIASSASGANPMSGLTTDALDTILEFAGSVAPAIPTASNGNAFLSGDVSMTNANTFYDGPNTGSIGASGETLLLIGQVTVVGGAGGVNKVTARLTDGTTVFNEGEGTATASSPISLSLFAIVNPSAAKTYKITATSTQNSATMKRDPVDNSSGAHVATAIGWVRLA